MRNHRLRPGLRVASLSPKARAEYDRVLAQIVAWHDPANPTYRMTTTLVAEPSPFVTYATFRDALAPGDLALLLDINYRDRRRGKSVIEIPESKVQGHGEWQRTGLVPRDVMTYLADIRPQIESLRNNEQITWTLARDQQMLDLLIAGHSPWEVAYRLSTRRCWISVGAIRGRRYNTLASTRVADLRGYGLSEAQIRYLRPGAYSRPKAALSKGEVVRI